MGKLPVIQKLEQAQLKTEITEFRVGDTVRVHTRIIEGEKERIQVFAGTVIARKGTGLSETISIHRIAYGEGMERVFLIHSPRVAQIELVKEGRVRRNKLYYLRGTKGKKAKVPGRVTSRQKGKGKAQKEVIDHVEQLAIEPKKPALEETTAGASPQAEGTE